MSGKNASQVRPPHAGVRPLSLLIAAIVLLGLAAPNVSDARVMFEESSLGDKFIAESGGDPGGGNEKLKTSENPENDLQTQEFEMLESPPDREAARSQTLTRFVDGLKRFPHRIFQWFARQERQEGRE